MNIKIRKQQIIIELFGYITYCMIRKHIFDPYEIQISLHEFEKYLNEKMNTDLKSVRHLYQQICAYEREHFFKIFHKEIIRAKDNIVDVVITLVKSECYKLKLYLHIGLKLALANGACDLLNHLYEYEKTQRALNVYLSAGSESYYLAQHLFDSYIQEMNIYTHNLGIIENYLRNYIHLKNIQIYTRFGMIHKESFAILEGVRDNYADTKFDIIIGTTSYINKNGLYIESKTENEYKSEVYKMLTGPRVLILTFFEWIIPKKIKKYSYTTIDTFDYMIVPSEKIAPTFYSKLSTFSFESIIKYYTYEVFKRIKK